tara:strand:+ start:204 stop:926 length:723 start_codon:yes stop_codon:yes gene_type:complete
MFASNSQVGRTRVNKIREGNKRPPKGREINKGDGFIQLKKRSSNPVKKNSSKKVGNVKQYSVTGFQKLLELQDFLIKEGMSFSEYQNYTQEKINNDKYYYVNLNDKQNAELLQRYRRLCQKKNDRNNAMEEKHNKSKEFRKQHRSKVSDAVREKKREKIDELFKEINRSTSIGVIRNTSILSSDPDRWIETKKLLFLGGRYLETQDKNWCKVYLKIESPVRAHLFDLHNGCDLSRFIEDS